MRATPSAGDTVWLRRGASHTLAPINGTRYEALARLPIRLLGLMLLTIAVSVASCQALFSGLSAPERASIERSLERGD